jgi:A/G-specific adenine glycosylase
MEIGCALLAWSEHHLPEFPWMHRRDPYTVWLAVVMLQQTRVATVLPYYTRFLGRYPTMHDLAAAPLVDVLKSWEGLGYYARARNLHAAAQIVVSRRGGHLPTSRGDLESLPGIGDYTAGAILSIAFGQDEPAVDGNVRRVLSRLFAISGDVRKASVRRHLDERACLMMPPGRASHFNQGLMHLGAVICTARQPLCGTCPLATFCEARRRGVQSELPTQVRRRPVPHYDVAAAVIRDDEGHILIAQRRMTDMLGGLWEFPGGRREPDEALPECLRREILEELGLEIEVGELLTTVKHSYSHFRITLHALNCRTLGGQPQAIECADWRWVRPEQLDSFPLSVADQKVRDALRRVP